MAKQRYLIIGTSGNDLSASITWETTTTHQAAIFSEARDKFPWFHPKEARLIEPTDV